MVLGSDIRFLLAHLKHDARALLSAFTRRAFQHRRALLPRFMRAAGNLNSRPGFAVQAGGVTPRAPRAANGGFLMKPTYLFSAAAALFLLAAPISLAQVTSNPATPPTATPATPATPAEPAAPTPGASPGTPVAPGGAATPAGAPATPATPATPAAPAQSAANASAEGQPACRTRKDVGEQCSCLSAPTNFGTSAAAENGSHNMCVVPN
jgi:hypothetical protein